MHLVHFLVDVWHWLTAGDQWHGGEGVPHLLANHLRVSISSLVVSAAIAVPLGAWLGHRGVGGVVAINVANIGRAIPIYALLVLAVQIFGITSPRGFGWTGSFVAFVPLVLLGIPPMLTNSYIGVRDVGDELVDAARGMGLSEGEILRRVEIPVAMPLIMAGIRTAMVGIIATATLASFYRRRHARDADLHRAQHERQRRGVRGRTARRRAGGRRRSRARAGAASGGVARSARTRRSAPQGVVHGPAARLGCTGQFLRAPKSHDRRSYSMRRNARPRFPGLALGAMLVALTLILAACGSSSKPPHPRRPPPSTGGGCEREDRRR